MSTDPTLQAQYLEGLRDLTDGAGADGETHLARAEHSILEADPPDGDGIDSVLMAAFSLPDPYSQRGVDRRLAQLRDEGEPDDGFAEWVYNRSRDEYDRRVKVATARLALVVALDAIEQATNDATAALDGLHDLIDLAIISPQRGGVGIRFSNIDNALNTVRVGVAAALHHAPDPERNDG